jgi:ribosomal protein S27AE
MIYTVDEARRLDHRHCSRCGAVCFMNMEEKWECPRCGTTWVKQDA